MFLAENSTRLAIKILSNVAQGRGAHLSQDTGFSDGNRFEKCGVNLLRPLRDISSKEIVMYIALHKVSNYVYLEYLFIIELHLDQRFLKFLNTPQKNPRPTLLRNQNVLNLTVRYISRSHLMYFTNPSPQFKNLGSRRLR